MTDPMDDLRQASTDVSGVEVLNPAAQMEKELILYIPQDLYWQVVIAAAKHKQDPETWIIGVLEGLIEDQEEYCND